MTPSHFTQIRGDGWTSPHVSSQTADSDPPQTFPTNHLLCSPALLHPSPPFPLQRALPRGSLSRSLTMAQPPRPPPAPGCQLRNDSPPIGSRDLGGSPDRRSFARSGVHKMTARRGAGREREEGRKNGKNARNPNFLNGEPLARRPPSRRARPPARLNTQYTHYV